MKGKKSRIDVRKYSNCEYFELQESIDRKELNKYYCWHKNNMESECEYASCPLGYNTNIFEDLGDSKTEKKEYQLKFRDIMIDIIDIMGYNKDDGEIKDIQKYLENIDNEYVLVIKKEFNKFKKVRKELGLKSFDLINIKQMEKNLKGENNT